MSDVQVEPNVLPLSRLLDELLQGRLRVPRFQRRFVWSGDRVVNLLTSVRRRYPIGSLLIWRSSPNHRCFDKVGPHPVPTPTDRPSEVGYLLDGHQRLSSLLGTLVQPPAPLHGEERAFAVYYDLKEEKFVRGDPREPWHVPLWMLMDNIRVLDRTSELRPEGEKATQEARAEWEKRARNLKEVATAFQTYRVAVNEIQNADLDTAVNVFTLLNSTGVRVSPAEMFAALAWPGPSAEGASFDFTGNANAIRTRFNAFAGLDGTTVLRCLLARLGEDIYTTDFQGVVKKHRPGLPAEARAVEGTIGRALEFLQTRWGVASNKALPYALHVVLLSEFFRLNPSPSPEQQEELLKALWATAFTGSYAVGSTRVFSDAVEAVRRYARGEAGDLVQLKRGEMRPLPRKFHPRGSRVRAFFLFLKQRQPQLLDGSGPVPWDTLLERGLYDTALIVPDREYGDLLANRVLLGRYAGDVLKEMTGLVDQPDEVRRRILDPHLVSDEALLHLCDRDYPAFLKERERDIRIAETAFMSDYLKATASTEVVDDAELDADDDEDGMLG